MTSISPLISARFLFLMTAVLLVAAGCGSSDKNDDKSSFSGGSIEVEIDDELEQLDSTRSTKRVFFVVDKGKDPEKAAIACAEKFRTKVDQIQCWGFESQKAANNSKVDPKTGQMAKMCWTSYAMAAGPDGEIVTDQLKDKFKSLYNCDEPPPSTTFTKDDDASADDKSADDKSATTDE